MNLQNLYIFILALITIALMFLCFYAVQVLREFKETVKNINKVLKRVTSVTDALSNPFPSIVAFIVGVISEVRNSQNKKGGNEDV